MQVIPAEYSTRGDTDLPLVEVKVRFRFVESPWETRGLSVSGLSGELVVFENKVVVQWVEDEDDGPPGWTTFFFGLLAHLFHAAVKRIDQAKNKEIIRPERSLAVFDRRRREISFMLPDESWVAVRMRGGRARREFPELVTDLQGMFGEDHMHPGRFGKASGTQRLLWWWILSVVAAAVGLGVLLHAIYG